MPARDSRLPDPSIPGMNECITHGIESRGSDFNIDIDYWLSDQIWDGSAADMLDGEDWDVFEDSRELRFCRLKSICPSGIMKFEDDGCHAD